MKKILIILVFLVLSLTLINSKSQAEQTATESAQASSPTPTPDSARINDLQNQIKELEGKISDSQKQQKTLSSQINVMTSQIKLTELRIASVKQQILELSQDIEKTNKRISTLEGSLTNLTKVLFKRIIATYQVGSIEPVQVILTSNTISNFFTRANYLKMVQNHDKKLIFETQQAKNDYANQKDIFEGKKTKVLGLKTQLEGYTSQLDQEKKTKQSLLDVTKNDEKKFQDMLARARAEYQAIQGIAAGMGQETEVGGVKEGDLIATVIQGGGPPISYCSTGTHLHFEVRDNGALVNPAEKLSSKDVNWDLCGWFGCDSSVGFNGSWQWPLNGKPTITQGFGMTAYARSGAYGGGPHTGIDMVSDDLAVKAVREGSLYRGSIACGGGRLRYVKVKHSDSGIESYYLHVNYIL